MKINKTVFWFLLLSIQIVIGNFDLIKECIPFGQSQNPNLYEYADDIDTMKFLNQL